MAANNMAERQRPDRRCFPICQLQNVAVVDQLPPGCPLAERWVFRALNELQDRARRILDHEGIWGDHRPGLAALPAFDIRARCAPTLIRNSRVGLLRDQLGADQMKAENDAQPDPARPPEKAAIRDDIPAACTSLSESSRILPKQIKLAATAP